MARPPRFRAIRPEDLPGEVPEWAQTFLLTLNDALGTIANALTGGLTREDNFRAGERVGLTFRTEATVANTWPVEVKHGMPVSPRHVVCSRMDRVDGAAHSAAWSMSWKLGTNGLIQLTFQGLSASTEYRFNLLYE